MHKECKFEFTDHCNVCGFYAFEPQSLKVNPEGSSLEGCVHFLTIAPEYKAYTNGLNSYTIR